MDPASAPEPSAPTTSYSTVQDYGEYGSSCGYCKGKGETSFSHGMQAIRLTAYDYQDLIDQGWRRSGTFLYKPNLEKSCCKSYTIRLHAPSCMLNKDQKRVLSKLERYVQGKAEGSKSLADGTPTQATTGPSSRPAAEPDVQLLQQCLTTARDAWVAATGAPVGPYPPPSIQRPPPKALKSLPVCTQFASACAFATAAAARKLQPSFSQPPAAVATSLAEQFNTLGCPYQAVPINGHLNFISTASSITTTAITASTTSPPLTTITPHPSFTSPPQPIPSTSGPSSAAASQLPASISTTSATPSTAPKSPSPTSPPKKRPVPSPLPSASPSSHPRLSPTPTAHERQTSHAEAGASDVAGGPSAQRRPSTSGPHTWEVKLVPSMFIEEEYQLYRKYQIQQHNDSPDKVSKRQYKEFLVLSPLTRVVHERDPSSPACGYGSFHQQYWLDGQLVAVGVIDILPRCLSSVYLFWDPDFAHLAPGKLTALKEIQWVAAACAPPSPCPQLQWYYMGFYIPTCRKMRYKGDYQPSDLLCPRARAWVRLTPEVSRAVDAGALVVLSELQGAVVSPNLALPGGRLTEPAAATVAAAPAPVAAEQAEAGQEVGRGASEARPKDSRRPYRKVTRTSALVDEVIAAVGHVQVPMKVLLPKLQKAVADNLAEQVQRWTAVVGPQLSTTMRYALQ